MNEHPIDLLPELILLGGAVAGLLAGLYLPRRRQGLVAALAATCAVTAAAAAGWQWAGPVRMAFQDSYRVDDLTSAVRVTITVSVLLLLPLARSRFAGDARESEVYVLMLLAALGAITLAGAHDLMLLMGAYTLASVPLYALVAFVKDATGTEAGIKYYLMGALFGLVMLAGITVVYGLAGGTAYPALPGPLDSAARGPLSVAVVAIIAGLSFKAGAVPAHFWVPDVAEGASTAVAAFVTTVPKIGALAALFRLVDGPLQNIGPAWRLLVAVIATASMSLGNLAAFFQDSPRRLLAYSTISQVGYLLLPVVARRTHRTGAKSAPVLPRRLRPDQHRSVRSRRRPPHAHSHPGLPGPGPPVPTHRGRADRVPARPARHPAARRLRRQTQRLQRRRRCSLRVARGHRGHQHRRQPLLLPTMDRLRVRKTTHAGPG